MTHRTRMLTAYRRGQPDRVPVSPELWYDMGVLIDRDCTWQDICFGRYPLWRAQLAAHRYFGSAAWLIASAKGHPGDGDVTTNHCYTPDGALESHHVGRCSKGTLQWGARSNESFYDWVSEHPIKDLDRDLEAFEVLFMPDAATLDLGEIDEAMQGVADDGIVTAYVGSLFFSFVATHLAGGPTAAVLAMMDRPSFFEAFQQRYVTWLVGTAEKIMTGCDARIVLLDNGYSTGGIINVALYEKWDLPVIRAISRAARAHGRILHLHQHGKCGAFMDLIASTGVDLVDPFERPPSGDTGDLGAVKREYGDRIALRGNMHAHRTLLRGTPDDVEAEARECIRAAGEGGGFILASGDGVIAGTPFDNIFRMVEAGEEYGAY